MHIILCLSNSTILVPKNMRIYMGNSVFTVLLLLLTGIAELCSCGTASTFFGCIERERKALLNFKRSLTFDFAASSQQLFSWEGHGCCQWEGISCDNVTGHVVKLDLKDPCSPFQDSESESTFEAIYEDCPSLAHAQHLSPSLSQLEHLSYLDLSRINIKKGPIPTFLGSMQRLRYLSVSGYDNLQTMIPRNLGNLTNLNALYIMNSGITHGIGWLARLSSLQYLGMYDVRLWEAHDLFQVLNKLPSLLEIHLSDCGLGNMPIPSHPITLTNLTRVRVLNLASNFFQDPFLNALKNLTSIRVLDISSSNLNSMPSWLAKFEKLVYLNLAGALNNQVLDPLKNLTSSIKVLDLSSNKLTSLPPWFCDFNNLALSLVDNDFSGKLPYALQNITSIRALDFRHNNLSSIPTWLSKFKNLVWLDLSENLLYGPIPYALRNLTSLRFLELSVNSFTSLPLWLGDLKSLVRLHLSANNFTSLEEGSISSILRNLCHLKEFGLATGHAKGLAFQSNEDFFGCNNYDLEMLDLRWNEFGGSLPSWLGQIKNLKLLLLSSNSFSGPIPFSLGNLTNLTQLRLGGNSLNGSIPPSLVQLVNLEYLDLSSNNLDGVIPKSLGQLKHLIVLDLSSNHFDGVIPQSLDELKNLNVLNLSSNYLEGTFTWPQMTTLAYLSLSYNQIAGSLPKSLGDIMPKLRFMLLHNNLMNGSIPSSLGKIKTMYCFDVSNNKLSGNIPSTLWNLSSLVWLHLNNNNFDGALPSSLTNMKYLKILDIGENQLSGAMPSWNGKRSPYLQILRMRRNMFNGSIPSSLCQFVRLQILDLAENNLSGSIPQCIGNIRGMVLKDFPKWDPIASDYLFGDEWKYEDVKQVIKGRELDYIRNLKYVINLDLSHNFLIGSIPHGISSLSGLQGLNMSYNNLFGEIPEMIGDMKSLESIDFSHNQLFGAVPQSMSALTFLSHLNLSYNNFSGPIPRGNQFEVLNDPLIYTGNPHLCGAPLQNCLSDDSHQVPHSGQNDESDKVWFYFTMALGFTMGFWGVIGVLVLKKNWRHAYFEYVDEATERIYAVIVMKVAKLKKRVQ